MKAERFEMGEVRPDAYKLLLELDRQLRNSALTSRELTLIYVRASQINGCAFCLQMHLQEARESGERQYRLHALPYWRESPFFTAEEQLIIQITEQVTAVADQGLTAELYEAGIKLLGQEKVADIIMAIICINAWNRIGRATLPVPQRSRD